MSLEPKKVPWTALRGPSKTPEQIYEESQLLFMGPYEPSASAEERAWSQRIVSDPAFRRAEEAANTAALEQLLLNLTPAEFNRLQLQGIDPFAEHAALMARGWPQ